jgi:cytosine/adenosine deaminase-related metal-dependent hydrolase
VRAMQTLVRGGTIVTCDAEAPWGQVLEGSVLIRDGQIVEVGSGPQISRALSGKDICKVIDAEGCAIIPGFVQAHIHLCQTLFRGMADDLHLLSWLRERIWPLEAAHDEKSSKASAELGLVEMMRAGTTTILDMGTVNAHDAVMDACVRSGIRAVSGKTMMDSGEGVPKRLLETTRRSLDESERLARDWDGANHGRIRYGYAPRFILSCSEELIRGVAALAKSRGAIVHTHAAEQAPEREAVRDALGDDDIAILRKWGVSGARAVFAHGVQLRDDEAKQIAKEGTRIVHCPSSNLKLASGIARIAELDAFGVQLALGADGAPCNNNLDPWTEMRHAALGAKIKTGVTSLPAARVFRLATIDGARALGLDSLIGSIEPGKQADLAIVRIDREHVEPGGNIFSKLVYACQARDVAHVMVRGELVVTFGEHLLLDAEKIVSTARAQAKILTKRAGL